LLYPISSAHCDQSPSAPVCCGFLHAPYNKCATHLVLKAYNELTTSCNLHLVRLYADQFTRKRNTGVWVLNRLPAVIRSTSDCTNY